MDVPSRTSAPTPVLIRATGLQIFLGKVRPFTSPGRGPSTGSDHCSVLVEQTYPGVEDEEAHFAALLPAFRDDRYLRVNGRPLFHVYNPGGLPAARAFVDHWQTMARRAGLEGLYLVAGVDGKYSTHIEDGFDAGVHPRLPYVRPTGPQLMTRFRRKVLGHPLVRPYANQPLRSPLEGVDPARMQPCVFPNWDNTPRSGKAGVVLTGAKPEYFGVHLRAAIESLAERPREERILWIKSWNEWAEGNYLEPDSDTGDSRLRVLRDELFAP